MTGQLINAEIIRILSPKSYTQSGMRAHHKDDKELSWESFGPLTDYTRKHDNSAFTQSPCSWRNACSGTEAFSTGRDDAPYVYLRGAPAVLSAARKCLQAAKKTQRANTGSLSLLFALHGWKPKLPRACTGLALTLPGCLKAVKPACGFARLQLNAF